MTTRGFTLIELLAVVLIMGILTAIAVPQYRSSVERSRIAEAMQMLPAIFDSRERMMEEQQVADKNEVTFFRIDMDMKGRVAEDHELPEGEDNKEWYWITDSFRYRLFDPTEGSDAEYQVSATLRRGKFSGAILYFDGSVVRCCKGDSESENTCDILNVPELVPDC